MADFNMTISGLSELQSSLTEKANNLSREIDAEIGFACDKAISYMQADVPVDQGFLRNHITKEHVGDMNYTIVSQSDYSAYLEFGTRGKVEIPAGLEGVAAQAQGSNGNSGDVKQMIFDWCQRKGIDPKLWYPIFISIMVNGISPHPFFFANFERVKPELLTNVQNVLSEGF